MRNGPFNTPPKSSKVRLPLSQPVVDGQKSPHPSPPLARRLISDLYAALVDPKHTTEARGGENGGRHLQHAGVVRGLQRVGRLKDLGAGPVSLSLNAPADAKPGEMRVVVFAEESGQGAVLGAASAGVTLWRYYKPNPTTAINI
jgi:hypothetical protein